MRVIKAGESDADILKVYFDVRLTDNISPALSEAGGQPLLSVNGGAFSSNGLSTLTSFGYGQYYAVLDPTYLLVPGDILIPIYQGSTTLESRAEPIQVIDPNTYVAPTSATPIQYYGSIVNGNIFFSQMLNTDAWDQASNNDKIKALTMATRAIDRLNFAGIKLCQNQLLQFPRKNVSFLFPTLAMTGDNQDISPTEFTHNPSAEVIDTDYGLYLITKDTVIPTDIENAAYIIALRLLDGYDADTEQDNLMATSNKQGNAVTSYDRTWVPDYIKAGIPSATAWGYLRPYLRDPHDMQFIRAT